MRIVIDEAIPDARRLFGEFGEVVLTPGRGIEPADVVDADALVVRSVTRVDEQLLAGSRVRFVGTVTSRTDHVDGAWLASRGVAIADAAGCNSAAVAEYVLAALVGLAESRGFVLADRTLGVVGAGRIGSRVIGWARAMGMRVVVCDPPLERATRLVGSSGAGVDQGGMAAALGGHVLGGSAGASPSQGGMPAALGGNVIGGSAGASPSRAGSPFGGSRFAFLTEVAENADIITLHVPLTRDGPDATADLIDAAFFARLRPGALFVNTSRGEVVREEALHAAIRDGRLSSAVLDVWRNEPAIDASLVERAAVATPHIAGYTIEAKRRGAEMVRDALRALIAGGRDSRRAGADVGCRNADVGCQENGDESSNPTSAISHPTWSGSRRAHANSGPPIVEKVNESSVFSSENSQTENTPAPALTRSDQAALWRALRTHCDPFEDTARFRARARRDGPALAFESFRSSYSSRRELSGRELIVDSPGAARVFAALGCRTQDS